MYGPIVWIEGLMGSGKTTLTKKLAAALELRALLEPVDDNPYLEMFYKEPKRWAFPMQIDLLHRRYAMQKLAAYEATAEGGYRGAILDRGLPGDRVFCREHLRVGNIHPLEYATYEGAYQNMVCSLIPPSYLVFLDVEPQVAMDRVRERSRGCESAVSLEYLRALQRGYYDMLVEIDAGAHAWARGIKAVRIPWNVDDQAIEPIVDMIRDFWKK